MGLVEELAAISGGASDSPRSSVTLPEEPLVAGEGDDAVDAGSFTIL